MIDDLPRQFGKYRLERRLGVGGMAETFVARREGAGGIVQHVCIKRVLPAFHRDPEFIRQFQREAKLAAKLRHQNIVQVLDFGYVGETLYMALELVRGVDLRDFLQAQPEKKLDPEYVALVAHDMIYALDYAHRPHDGVDGIVHRDVTPSNVLLSRNGHAKLADFGVAKAIGTSTVATATGVMKGKMPYMPAEQMKGAAVDGRTDLFSLGVVLFEALAGRRPFTGAHDVEVMSKIVSNTRPKLKEVAPHVPDGFCEVVEKLLGPEPQDRYADADAVLDAIAPYVPAPKFRRLLADQVRDCYGDTERGPDDRDTQMADMAELPANVPGAIQVAVPSEPPVSAAGPTQMAPSQPPPRGPEDGDGPTRVSPSEIPPSMTGRKGTLYGMGPASDAPPPPEEKATHLDLGAQARAAAAARSVVDHGDPDGADEPDTDRSPRLVVPPPGSPDVAPVELPSSSALPARDGTLSPRATRGRARRFALGAAVIVALVAGIGAIVALTREPSPGLRASHAAAPLAETTGAGAASEAAASEAAANETAANETAANETAANETAANETAANETAANETAASETAATETAANETAANETAANETAASETAATETLAVPREATAAPAPAAVPIETAATPPPDERDDTPVALTVACIPWGEVWVGSRYMGRAPVQLRLPPGTHTIRAGAGSPQFSKRVRLRPGRRRASVTFDLDQLMQQRASMR